MRPPPPLLDIKGLRKSFSGVTVLDGVDLELYAGEVHALVGQNGAGKSTLIKLIVGGLKRDSGEIMLNGETKNYLSPEQACHDGIGVIYQETSLISQMTVLENIFLGVEPLNVANLIDENKMRKKFFETCNLLRIVMDPDQIVSRLSIVKKKLVEIMKALVRESRILIMDEPTDSLQKQEINHLLKIIEDLKSNQAAVFYITHKFEEVFRVADRISVLRDGKKVQTANVPDTTIDEVIRLMVGESRVSREEIKTSPEKKRQTVLRVEGVTKKDTLHNVSFDLQAGEIVAITGLVGAGKTELARILFGADRFDEGRIYFQGREVCLHSPQEAVKMGICLVPEDRNREGLIMNFEIYKNVTLPTLHKFKDFFGLSRKREMAAVADYAARLGINAPDGGIQTRHLSGGNLQKLVIAKWLLSRPKVLLLDEPTRGMDVKAKGDVLGLVKKVAAEGCGIVTFSSDIAEALQAADRVLVLHQGRIIRETGAPVTEAEIISTIFGDESRVTIH